jgi:hypothetical protein
MSDTKSDHSSERRVADKTDPLEQQWWPHMAGIGLDLPLDTLPWWGEIGLLEPSKQRVTTNELRLLGRRDGACYSPIESAEEAVIEALEAGRLSAYGSANGAGDLKEIPLLLWADPSSSMTPMSLNLRTPSAVLLLVLPAVSA